MIFLSFSCESIVELILILMKSNIGIYDINHNFAHPNFIQLLDILKHILKTIIELFSVILKWPPYRGWKKVLENYDLMGVYLEVLVWLEL